MGIRSAFKDRFSDGQDVASRNLRRQVRRLWADKAEANKPDEDDYDYIVMETGERKSVQKDKAGGVYERTPVTLNVVTADGTARCERLVTLTRACFEAVRGRGRSCTLVLGTPECFIQLEYVGDSVGPDPRFPGMAVGEIKYSLLSYRDPAATVCSSSESSTSSSSSGT